MTATTPAQAIELFAAHMTSGDLDGAMALYEPDAVFAPEPGRQIAGHAAIRAALEGFAALKPRMRSEIVQVLEAGDTALVTNRWALEGTQPDGSPVQMSGTSSDVVRRQPDGSWQVLVDDPWSGG
jgi:uncharacterized protein (TIGR02246 family)